MTLDQQVLNEFIANCRQRDLIKARLVLEHCDRIDPVLQKRILYELNKTDDEFALPLMLFIAVRHSDALEKHLMLSESIRERALRSPAVLRSVLEADDTYRNAYIDLVGELDLKAAVPWLLALVKQSNATGTLTSCLEAFGRMKAQNAVGAVAGLLGSDEPQVVDLAMETLGRIATQTAIKALNGLLTAGDAHVRNRAKFQLVKIGEKAATVVADNLMEKDVDLLIHSLNILQLIGHQSSVAGVRHLINNRHPDTNVRFAAYEALAALPLRRGDYVLAAGLTDTDYSIRLAAARAIDQHLDDSLLSGIGNMMIAEDEEAEHIARAILDSQSASLTKGLLENYFFSRFLIRYLSGRVDNGLRFFYLNLLRDSGKQALIVELEEALAQTGVQTSGGRICAVDDSTMILKVYQSILNELSYEPVLFEKPEDFLDWLPNNKPVAVFTDLNMPGMTGVELTRKARDLYSLDRLPIIMVTTQNDEGEIERANEAGVNEVIMKPFDIEKIRSILARYLTAGNG